MAVADKTAAEAAPETSTRLRHRPTQERSRKTVEAILAAAAALLEEAGWDGFNTNTLAEQAGVRVATIYRYFPDKLALATELAERVVAAWRKEIAAVDADPRPLRVLWPDYLDRYLKMIRATPGALAVRQAMRAAPELRALDDADSAAISALMTETLVRRIPHLAPARAAAAAATLVESAAALIDHAHRATDAETAVLLEEAAAMHDAYFERLEAAALPQPLLRKENSDA